MRFSSHNSGDFFTTPQMEKRQDGLCPSLLSEDYSSANDAQAGNGRTSIVDVAPMTTSYETNTQYLNASVRDAEDTSFEVEFICDSITSFLKELVDEETQSTTLVSLNFEPKGCIWVMDLNPSLGATNYQIQVVCLARGTEENKTTFVVDTHLFDKAAESIAPTTLKCAEAKAVFETTALVVRKAVVKCEFPDFSEGCQGRAFKEVYKLNKKLKSGAFSTICLGTHRETGKAVIVKCVNRLDLPLSDDAAVYDEVSIMSFLSHPYIVPLVDFFEEEDTYYIVKERMSGSDILERVGNIGENYNEGDVRGIIANLLKAVSHCHSHNIAHRDINAKNILLTGEESNTDIKLTGFALAARCHEPKSLTQQCGTPFFAAPEVLTRKPYDQEADLWAIGCFAFLLLSGTLPFVGQTQKELFRNIVSGKFEFDEDYWGDVSVDARAFVKKLLVVNPGKRLTADAALKLLWMQVSYAYLEKHNLEEAAERIKTFYERMTPKHAD